MPGEEQNNQAVNPVIPAVTQQSEQIAEDLVDYKHPKTGEILKVSRKVMDGFNHQFKNARVSEGSKWEEKFRQLSDEYSKSQTSLEEYSAQLQKIEDEKLSETERIKKEAEREIKKRDAVLKEYEEKANKNYSLFRDTKIDNDLMGAISGIGNGIEATNPQQLALLLKTLGKAELVEENGNYVTKISLTIDGESAQMNPKEAVIKFLSLPENAHHIKNNLRSGGGTSSAGTRTNGNGVAVFTKADMADPIKRKAYLDLSKAGKNPILEQ